MSTLFQGELNETQHAPKYYRISLAMSANIQQRIKEVMKRIVLRPAKCSGHKRSNPIVLSPRSMHLGKKIALAWSGGKNFVLLLHKAQRLGFDIKMLFNLIDRKRNLTLSARYNKDLLRLQARCLDKKILQVDLGSYSRRGFVRFLKQLKKTGIESIGMGYIDEGLRGLMLQFALEADLEVFEPLYGQTGESLMNEILSEQISAVIVGIDSNHLSKEYLGTIIDRSFINQVLGKSIHPCGANNEYQSFVVHSPHFQKKIEIKAFEEICVDHFYYLYVKNAVGKSQGSPTTVSPFPLKSI